MMTQNYREEISVVESESQDSQDGWNPLDVDDIIRVMSQSGGALVNDYENEADLLKNLQISGEDFNEIFGSSQNSDSYQDDKLTREESNVLIGKQKAQQNEFLLKQASDAELDDITSVINADSEYTSQKGKAVTQNERNQNSEISSDVSTGELSKKNLYLKESNGHVTMLEDLTKGTHFKEMKGEINNNNFASEVPVQNGSQDQFKAAPGYESKDIHRSDSVGTAHSSCPSTPEKPDKILSDLPDGTPLDDNSASSPDYDVYSPDYDVCSPTSAISEIETDGQEMCFLSYNENADSQSFYEYLCDEDELREKGKRGRPKSQKPPRQSPKPIAPKTQLLRMVDAGLLTPNPSAIGIRNPQTPQLSPNIVGMSTVTQRFPVVVISQSSTSTTLSIQVGSPDRPFSSPSSQTTDTLLTSPNYSTRERPDSAGKANDKSPCQSDSGASQDNHSPKGCGSTSTQRQSSLDIDGPPCSHFNHGMASFFNGQQIYGLNDCSVQGASPQLFDASGQQFGAHGQQFGAPGQQFDAQGQQFGAPFQQFGAYGQHFGAHGQQFGAHGQQFGAHGQQFGAPSQQIGGPYPGQTGRNFPASPSMQAVHRHPYQHPMHPPGACSITPQRYPTPYLYPTPSNTAPGPEYNFPSRGFKNPEAHRPKPYQMVPSASVGHQPVKKNPPQQPTPTPHVFPQDPNQPMPQFHQEEVQPYARQNRNIRRTAAHLFQPDLLPPHQVSGYQLPHLQHQTTNKGPELPLPKESVSERLKDWLIGCHLQLNPPDSGTFHPDNHSIVLDQDYPPSSIDFTENYNPVESLPAVQSQKPENVLPESRSTGVSHRRPDRVVDVYDTRNQPSGAGFNISCAQAPVVPAVKPNIDQREVADSIIDEMLRKKKQNSLENFLKGEAPSVTEPCPSLEKLLTSTSESTSMISDIESKPPSFNVAVYIQPQDMDSLEKKKEGQTSIDNYLGPSVSQLKSSASSHLHGSSIQDEKPLRELEARDIEGVLGPDFGSYRVGQIMERQAGVPPSQVHQRSSPRQQHPSGFPVAQVQNTNADVQYGMQQVSATSVNGRHPANVNGHHPANVNGHHPPNANGHHPANVNGHHPANVNGHHSPNVNGHHPANVNGHHPANVNGHHPPNVNGHHPPSVNGHHPPSVNGHHSPNVNGHHPASVSSKGSYHQRKLATPSPSSSPKSAAQSPPNVSFQPSVSEMRSQSPREPGVPHISGRRQQYCQEWLNHCPVKPTPSSQDFKTPATGVASSISSYQPPTLSNLMSDENGDSMRSDASMRSIPQGNHSAAYPQSFPKHPPQQQRTSSRDQFVSDWVAKCDSQPELLPESLDSLPFDDELHQKVYDMYERPPMHQTTHLPSGVNQATSNTYIKHAAPPAVGVSSPQAQKSNAINGSHNCQSTSNSQDTKYPGHQPNMFTNNTAPQPNYTQIPNNTLTEKNLNVASSFHQATSLCSMPSQTAGNTENPGHSSLDELFQSFSPDDFVCLPENSLITRSPMSNAAEAQSRRTQDSNSMVISLGSESEPLSFEPDEDGETCLHLLCDIPTTSDREKLSQHPSFHKVLNLQNNNGETPLFLAVKNGRSDVARFFISHGADTNIYCLSLKSRFRTESVQHVALHEAVELGDLEMVKTLLTSNTINVDATRANAGLTPLMLAMNIHSKSSRRDIIISLINRGASLDKQEAIQGKTPLMYAIESRDVTLVEEILRTVGAEKARALVTAAAKNGNTCLHWAAGLSLAKQEKQRLLRCIIIAGGDASVKNVEGETPRDWARQDITEVLQNLGRMSRHGNT
ncbi:uncharacterized protein LOC131931315 [Physella acuta]|uniref:uncharacterized protein LOC131931315 n=1 Tax=Physella acuta TaxID=109671 RepID=UPI0027DCB612|nr:uncharacterized protein LOC131931315 [Physella acuta]XP_059144048.1 uncharacterized protein LOC131931315 [Physella acuta]XP_059144049.1 uncharacterized protein LOC131931315 [Physella acuta]